MKTLLSLAVCIALGATLAPATHADSLDAQVVALFPKNCVDFSYADLAKARQFPWFIPFEMQVLPVRLYRFEKFLTSPQMGPGNQVNGVAWAVASGDISRATGIVGVAIGDFDTQTAESYLDTQKAPSFAFDGHTIYASNSDFGDAEIFFTFLDPSTVVFGDRSLVEDVIRVHNAEEHNLDDNLPMMALINQADDTDVFWGVLDAQGAQAAMRQSVPAAAQFPQAQQWIGKLDALVIGVAGSSDTGLSLSLNAVAATPQDALILSQLFQAGIAMKRYQSAQDDPRLAQILDTVDVAANGPRLGVSLDLTNDQILALIEQNIFALPDM